MSTQATQILARIEQGDPSAADELLPLVYDELRKLAAARLVSEKSDAMLQATALVHDVYIRLVDVNQAQHWNSRGHFFAAAAEAMRRILVEKARHDKRLRHGGGRERVEQAEVPSPSGPSPETILSVDEALSRLTAEDPAVAEIVKLHFFAGLTLEETAESLGKSRATVYRHWSYGRAFLRMALGGNAD
jgi:RNA polymerase sigma factor (TIGR02999 family)